MAAPNAVTDLAAAFDATTGKCHFTCTMTPDAVSGIIYGGTSPNPTANVGTIAADGTGSIYPLGGDQPTYYYRVKVANGSGEYSDYGNEITFVWPVVRYYLQNASADYTPSTIRGAWDSTASSVVKKLGRNAKSGAVANTAIAETSTDGAYDQLIARFVSDALTADQNIGQLVHGIFGHYETNAAADMYQHLHVFVTVGDSDTVRATLISDTIGSFEFATSTSSCGREFAYTGTEAVAFTGDRIVVEVGYRATNTVSTSYSGRCYYGGTSTDLTASGNGTTLTGWIDIALLTPAAEEPIEMPTGTEASATGSAPTVAAPDFDSGGISFSAITGTSMTLDWPAAAWECTDKLYRLPRSTDIYRTSSAGDELITSVSLVQAEGTLLATWEGPHAAESYMDDDLALHYHRTYAVVREYPSGYKQASFCAQATWLYESNIDGLTRPVSSTDVVYEGSYLWDSSDPYIGHVMPFYFQHAHLRYSDIEKVSVDGGLYAVTCGRRTRHTDTGSDSSQAPDASYGWQTPLALDASQGFRIEYRVRTDVGQRGSPGFYVYASEAHYLHSSLKKNIGETWCQRTDWQPLGAPQMCSAGSFSANTAFDFSGDANGWVDLAEEYDPVTATTTRYAKNPADSSWTTVGTFAYGTGWSYDHVAPPYIVWSRWVVGDAATEHWDTQFIKLVTGSLNAFSWWPGSTVDVMYGQGRTDLDHAAGQDDWPSATIASGYTSGVQKVFLLEGVQGIRRARAGCDPDYLSADQTILVQFEDDQGDLISDDDMPDNSSGFAMPSEGVVEVDLRGLEVPSLVMRITLGRSTTGTASPALRFASIEMQKVARPPSGEAAAEGYAPIVLIPVGADLDAPWHTLAPVAADLETLHSIRKTTGDSIDGSWNVQAAVGRELAALYHAKVTAGQETEAVWHALVRVNQSLAASWHDYSAAGRDFQSVWRALTAAGRDHQAVWSDRATVTQETEALWNARATVGKDHQALWNVNATIARALGAVWHDYITAAQTSSLVWRVRSLAARSFDGSWNQRALAGVSVETIWNAIAPPTLAGNAVQALWQVLTSTGAASDLYWNTNATAGAALAGEWHDRSAVGYPFQAVWNTQATTGRELSALWDIDPPPGLVGNDLASLWHVNAAVAQSLAGTWNDQAVTGEALEALWHTLQSAGVSTQALWRTRSATGQPLAGTWNVRSAPGRDLASGWHVYVGIPVGQESELVWSVLDAAGASLVVLWSVEPVPGTIVHEILIAAVRGQTLRAAVRSQTLEAAARSAAREG